MKEVQLERSILMERIEVEVLSQTTNAAVVRMPTRRFPGVVIQGDSLHILHQLAESVVQMAVLHADDELSGEAEGLRDLLAGYVASYEDILKVHGIDLPYYTDD
jgi:hypothetical protein